MTGLLLLAFFILIGPTAAIVLVGHWLGAADRREQRESEMDLDELAQHTIEGRLPRADERTDVEAITRAPVVILDDEDGEPIMPEYLRRIE